MLNESMPPEPFRFETRIRFIDTDASGRIHYTAMFRYFESAEIEWMRSRGIIYGGGDFTFPRVHVECDFKLALISGLKDLINPFTTFASPFAGFNTPFPSKATISKLVQRITQ